MGRSRVADMATTTFHEMVADPDVFVGGGSVAALTGAGAGATALLVMRLNARRKSLRDVREGVETDIERVEAIVRACESAADEDIRILAELLDAHREAKSSGTYNRYISALMAAARSPIDIAASIVDLMELIDRHIELSTRFTVSDLGAAAALAAGATRAALLTADVNIALLLEHQAADHNAVRSLDLRRAELSRCGSMLGDRIETKTRARLRGMRITKGTE